MKSLKIIKQYIIFFILISILNVMPYSIAYLRKNKDIESERSFPLNLLLDDRKPSKPYQPLRTAEDHVLRQAIQQPNTKLARHTLKAVSTENNRFHDRKNRSPKTSIRRRGINGIKLPINYIYPRFQQNESVSSGDHTKIQKKNLAIIKHSQPHFDKEEAEEEFAKVIPILIYTGTKGEMLFNTMLTVDHYPMLEPIPGQILHLPPTPSIFRRKPFTPRNYRTIRRPHTLRKNLTLIPFYAHEAIAKPQSLNFAEDALSTSSLLTGTTSGEEWKRGDDGDGDENRWHAYRSPNDVSQQPTRNINLPKSSTTSPIQLTSSVSPMHNHRWNSDEMDQVTAKQLMPREDDSEAGFKMTYTNDIQDTIDANSLERPQPAETSSQRPDPERISRISSATHELHAYRPGPSLTADDFYMPSDQKHQKTSVRNVDDDCCSSETWFILHSRYKGHHFKDDNKQRMSSKYFQV